MVKRQEILNALAGSNIDPNGFNIIFCNVPVVNDFIESKIVEQFGFIGEVALKILNFDHLPYFLKTNFYLKVWKCGEI